MTQYAYMYSWPRARIQHIMRGIQAESMHEFLSKLQSKTAKLTAKRLTATHGLTAQLQHLYKPCLLNDFLLMHT